MDVLVYTPPCVFFTYKLKTDVTRGEGVFKRKWEGKRGAGDFCAGVCAVFITLKKVEQDKHVSTDL